MSFLGGKRIVLIKPKSRSEKAPLEKLTSNRVQISSSVFQTFQMRVGGASGACGIQRMLIAWDVATYSVVVLLHRGA